MAEILALVALILAITAMNRSRKNAAKLTEEIRKLRDELNLMKADGVLPAPPIAAGADAALPAPADATAADGEAPFASPWLQARQEAGGTGERAQGEAAGDATQAVEAPSSMPAAAAGGDLTPVRESLESRIGARWAVWVGGLALALGGIFMVKYAIESGVLSPAVRLWLAALFGLALVAVGEVIRRRGQPVAAQPFQNAMIPGVLTAAGVVTLFGATYVAHGFYGFMGAPLTFVLLAGIAVATIGLSLLHGQALAGLGLLASMVTPLLVSTDEPDPRRLFAYLTIAWLATLAASRFRRWQAVPALANAGLGLWALLYLAAADSVQVLPLTLALIVMLAGVALLWPGSQSPQDAMSAASVDAIADGTRQPSEAEIATAAPREASAMAAASDGAAMPASIRVMGRWQRILAPAFMPVSLSAAIAATLPAIVLAFLHPLPGSAAAAFAALALALAALGAFRAWALYPAVLAHLCALAGTMVLAGLSGRLALETLMSLPGQPSFDSAAPISVAGSAPVNLLLLLSAGLALVGAAGIRLWREKAPAHAALCSLLMAAFPVAIAALSFAAFGNLSLDVRHGLFALAVGLLFFAGAEVFSRTMTEERGRVAELPQWALVSGGFAFLVLALFALTDGLATTLLVTLLGFAMVLSTCLRPWPVLPWAMVGAALVVAVRIGWEPTIVGAVNLSKTPLFNQLLPGYGGPALLLALSAYLLRAWPGERARNLLQALACLFVLLAVAILVRHAMNGGVLDSAAPTLGKQAIYTLLAAGASAVLMTLDLKSPSPVFRYGSMTIGGLSMLSILSAHFFALNPYFTGELTGRWPFFNLLLVGYLLPGLAFAGLAWYARGRRPAPYVTLLALTGAALVFAWISLSVRRYWHGEGIADWKGFLQGETYTYSVVWLLTGVALLVLGLRFDARSLRLASAALVFVAVIKAFLVDMSNLEGILRALSFIGLGAVLIGIGLFYQKILSGRGAPPLGNTSAPHAPTGNAGESRGMLNAE
ncbi:DUF2339 domain-containing protein [Mycoplana rhizolycopersici]|uniref:DUF2339 domain-containing protein n=1 Tax=Mycoplana rhizolycopersici TaxID=2746702 RepID=A0ABX2Q9A7_9HYPH|nr:DUF2339 domain-containing protein [Rhizobium rhizolycopersici]NVP54293.1 DUF2339 domain-containing protein [Rhizobium rhizolycopersici]